MFDLEEFRTKVDWQKPDYLPVVMHRIEFLEGIRAEGAGTLDDLRLFYKENPIQFIEDWGMTGDPRKASKGLPPVMPFILFPRQKQLLQFFTDCWKNEEPGVLEKSRDVGASWLAIAWACTMCIFHDDISIGFGSAVKDKVDRLGDPDSLFFKARQFISHLPAEFIPGWDVRKHTKDMVLQFPWTRSSITGECGDNIGRGGRKAVYFIDEAAHLEHPELADQALVANTDVRIDMSSVKGTANPFAEKARSGKYKLFTFHYRDDPRKDDAWLAKKMDAVDPVTWAQEYEIDYSASVENIIIPSLWVAAAIDAHKRLGIEVTGVKRAALDVADQGRDKNAIALRHGILLEDARSWSGKDSDLFATAVRACNICDEAGRRSLEYDADGVGASIRGDVRKYNEEREKRGLPRINTVPFRGSGPVMDPEHTVRGTDRKNKDFYKNFKAQAWWALRFRFQDTWRAMQGLPYEPDNIISISKEFAERARVVVELSQPVYDISGDGKMLVDKQPDGVASPNLGDSVMMVFAPKRPAMAIAESALS